MQHTLVMRVVDEDGAIQGPFVQKHWREEWRYEAESAHVYRGERTWQRAEAPSDRDDYDALIGTLPLNTAWPYYDCESIAFGSM